MKRKQSGITPLRLWGGGKYWRPTLSLTLYLWRCLSCYRRARPVQSFHILIYLFILHFADALLLPTRKRNEQAVKHTHLRNARCGAWLLHGTRCSKLSGCPNHSQTWSLDRMSSKLKPCPSPLNWKPPQTIHECAYWTYWKGKVPSYRQLPSISTHWWEIRSFSITAEHLRLLSWAPTLLQSLWENDPLIAWGKELQTNQTLESTNWSFRSQNSQPCFLQS